MSSFALAFPVLPGKTDSDITFIALDKPVSGVEEIFDSERL